MYSHSQGFDDASEDGRCIPNSTSQLFPLVYDELRKLAAAQLAKEPSGLTLQPTALVHEAYLKLTKGESATGAKRPWDNRNHFFSAAARAMREILVDEARKRKRLKRGGPDRAEVPLDSGIAAPELSQDILALHEALQAFSQTNEEASRLVELRCFLGLTNDAAAELLGVSPSTTDRQWRYARAWLQAYLSGE